MANTELKPKRSGKYHHNGNVRHGLYKDHKELFNLWQTMKTRCENPNRENYERYGSRGITVCEEWHEIAKDYSVPLATKSDDERR